MTIAIAEKINPNYKLTVIPVWQGPKAAVEVGSFPIKESLSHFTAKQGETLFVFHEKGSFLLLGLGPKEKASVEMLRKAYSAAVHAARGKKISSMNVLFPECKQKEKFLEGIAQGLLLTNYAFSYKSKEKKGDIPPLLEKICIVGAPKSSLIEETKILAQGVDFVRDLVNSNADDKIQQVLSLVKKANPRIKAKIFDKKKIIEKKMGLLLAVNRSSDQDPYLVHLEYRGNPKGKEHIVLIGKGVTYDTGGLSLKPTDNMVSMKCDMAGAATVFGAIETAANLGLKINVSALMPLTENSIGSKSYKLGDVYSSYSGQTVEINNTDAEGRLILADAISYAAEELAPSAIVDLATLTGACVVALGEDIAALFSDNEDLAEVLLNASDETDELLSRLPLHEAYRKKLKSDIADMVNSAGREAGAITAALFLKAFAKNVPWAHLDIAGPAYVNKPEYYNPHKGTGFGVRLLIEFLKGQIQ